MFRSKSEVDKHVGRLLSRLYTSTEVRLKKFFFHIYRFTVAQFNLISQKNKESFSIAKLYFDIREFKLANMYLANYLSEFSLDSGGWKMRAEIAELSDQNWTDAAEYYAQSFTLNESDSSILIKSKFFLIELKKIQHTKKPYLCD